MCVNGLSTGVTGHLTFTRHRCWVPAPSFQSSTSSGVQRAHIGLGRHTHPLQGMSNLSKRVDSLSPWLLCLNHGLSVSEEFSDCPCLLQVPEEVYPRCGTVLCRNPSCTTIPGSDKHTAWTGPMHACAPHWELGSQHVGTGMRQGGPHSVPMGPWLGSLWASPQEPPCSLA